MTAPERIWAAPPTDDPEWESGSGEWDVSENWAASCITEYVRADLAAVPAQAQGAKPLHLSDDLRGQLWQIVLKMTACDDDGCGQNNCSCMARYARILAASEKGGA